MSANTSNITNGEYPDLIEIIGRGLPEISWQAIVFLRRALLVTKGQVLDVGPAIIAQWLCDRPDRKGIRRMRQDLIDHGLLIPVEQRKALNGANGHIVFRFGEPVLALWRGYQDALKSWQRVRNEPAKTPLKSSQPNSPNKAFNPQNGTVGRNARGGLNDPMGVNPENADSIDEFRGDGGQMTPGGGGQMTPQGESRKEEESLKDSKGDPGRDKSLPEARPSDAERHAWLEAHGYFFQREKPRSQIRDEQAYQAARSAQKWEIFVGRLSVFCGEFFSGAELVAVSDLLGRALNVERSSKLAVSDRLAINKLEKARANAEARGWKTSFRRAA